jgi:hypothetical protein
MFNPFLTEGQLQLMINREITNAIRSQSSIPMPGPTGFNSHYGCTPPAPGAQPLITAALGQLLVNAIRKF